MTSKTLSHELPLEFLAEFQDKLRYTEEKYRHIPDPAAKINGMLKELSHFYDAEQTALIEIDWDLGVSVCTYAYSQDGIYPAMNVYHHVPMAEFAEWAGKIRANDPIIIDVTGIDTSCFTGHCREVFERLDYVMFAPFSNRLNAGMICIGNPKRFRKNMSFMLILGYAIVAALNEIKLQERVDTAMKQIAHPPENEVFISCFGGLEIHHAKGKLTDEMITADQCYRLLAYLVCNYKKARPVRELAEIIWNDAPLNDPYRDLKNVVYRLKRFLSAIELDDLIVGSGGTFVLNPKYQIYTDFDRFEDACNRFFNERNAERRESALKAARDSYKGLLLPRCDHIHWFIPRIGYYQTLYLRLMKADIELKLADKDFAAVQRIALEGLELEPYDTELITYQIISMFALGNRSLAKNYFNRMQTELSEEQIAIIGAYRK